MESLLVDTSVWIDFFKGRRSPESQKLHELIELDESVLLCPIIVQEILQGIREDDDFLKIKDILLNYNILSIDPVESALGASELYRNLRKKGTTIRKSNDCLIAFYAIYFNVKLLHKDSDFEKIAANSALRTLRLQT